MAGLKTPRAPEPTAPRKDNFAGQASKLLISAFCTMLVLFSVCGSALAARRQAQSIVVDMVPIPKLSSLIGCPASGWVHNQSTPGAGYLVTFYKLPSGQLWKSGTSNAAGKVNVTVPWGFKVYAQVQSLGLTSSAFNCPAQNSNK